MAKYTEKHKEESRYSLLNLIRADNNYKFYARVNTVSKSGMSRRIEFWLSINNNMYNINAHVAVLTSTSYNDNGVRVDGCGMDMVWKTFNDLSIALYGPDGHGYGLKKIDYKML